MPVKKNDYLANQHVKSFLAFLTSYVSGAKAFEHRYYDRRLRKIWICHSVLDAYKNYSYPLKKRFRKSLDEDFLGFEVNAAVLKKLQIELRDAYKICIKPASEKRLLDLSKDVFDWGGVLAFNGCWLGGYSDGGASICSLYDQAKKIFSSDEPDLTGILKTGVRSNAGFTKVYSLLFDDFIIYDSRVAAALGLFVVKYCKIEHLHKVPSELDFNWMPPKEAPKTENKKRRDATTGSLKFSRVNNDEKKHADSNIRANWLFSELLSNANYLGNTNTAFGDVKTKQDKMRALESSFFMIGYDLNEHPWLTSA